MKNLFEQIYLKPAVWCKLSAIVVLDADGWDRSANFDADWNKPLTWKEFVAKCNHSTCTTELNRLVNFETAEILVRAEIGSIWQD